jgi:hypothetical protein
MASFLGSSVLPGLSTAQRFLIAIAIDGAAVLWILPQRHALSGGPFMLYVATLPLPLRVALCVEATLLAAANSVFVVSASIAAVRMMAAGAGWYAFCCFVTFLGAAVASQRAILDRRPIALAGVLIGDFAVALGMGLQPMGAGWLSLIVAIACVGLGVLASHRFERSLRRRWLGLRARTTTSAVRAMSRHVPAILIQCKAVRARPAQAVFRIGAALALAFGASRLIAIFNFDSRSLPAAILAMALIGLLLAGIYRILFDAHRAMASYLATLPVPRHYWPIRDVGFVLLLNGVSLVILFAPEVTQGFSSLMVLFALVVASQCLLGMLRWPVIYGGSHRVIYSVLLAAIWSGAAIAAVSR